MLYNEPSQKKVPLFECDMRKKKKKRKKKCHCHTIEFVLQPSSAGQHNTVCLLTGKEDLQEQAEGIVAQCPQCNIGIIKRRDSFLWPTDFTLQLLERQSRGIQQRRRRTTRNIVADKGKEVDQDWQSKYDTESTYSIANVSSA